MCDWQYFLPVCGLSFCSLKIVFEQAEFLIFMSLLYQFVLLWVMSLMSDQKSPYDCGFLFYI